MAISEMIDEASQPAVRTCRTRLRGYLLRRGRQLVRLLLFLVIGLACLAAAVEIYRGASLIGLPDVGDPFDVAEFRAFRLPPEDDAFVLFRQAQKKLTGMPRLPLAVWRLGPQAWSKSAPELRDWVDANRDALEMLKAASERPDGIALPHPDQDDVEDYRNLGLLAELTRLEASRLEEQGDMTGAWNRYLAILRMQAHISRRGSMCQRASISSYRARLRSLVAAWAGDRRTSAALLRRALADVRACQPRPEWESYSLKVDYLVMMHELKRKGGWVEHGEPEDQQVKIGATPLPPNLAWTAYAARRFFKNEPERSRRVIRLAYANWLAHVGEKDPGRLKPAVRALFPVGKHGASASFYAAPAEAPPAARKLSPRQLAEWLVGSLDAKLLLSAWPWHSIRGSEQRQYRDLVVLLASELYERERGSPPPSDLALAGPYLDQLPTDGSEELDDGQTPTVRGDQATPTAKSR
jgi:hypothetical protein